MSMTDGLGSVWMFLPPFLWAVLFGVLIWMLATALKRRPEPVKVVGRDPEETLRELLARGEISAREYEEALASLRSGSKSPRGL